MDENHLYVQGYHESMPACKEMGVNYIWDWKRCGTLGSTQPCEGIKDNRNN